MGAVVALVNQKGGVGKTAAVVNLAASVAAEDARVLVVDADPQASASRALDPAETPFSLDDELDAGYEGAAASLLDIAWQSKLFQGLDRIWSYALLSTRRHLHASELPGSTG